jgi:CDP-glucose 4,6-dehydratase
VNLTLVSDVKNRSEIAAVPCGDLPTAFGGYFAGKRVLVTGHTGFKGSWLCEWLLALGAEITGYSLPPPTHPSLFEELGLAPRINHVVGDVTDYDKLLRLIHEQEPEVLFHLAAQPLVRLSYAEPLETYQTNVIGTANVLEALRQLRAPCAAVFITTDKCYENKEWLHSYREEDPLGGYDPYSSSKACAEIAVASFRRSFFKNHPVRIASARAGNVIGGGDWALDRLTPDCIRSLQKGESIPIRNRFSTRPWQHVLEPLSGYLALASTLGRCSDAAASHPYESAFNFGPALDANQPVLAVVQEILKHWPGKWEDHSDPNAAHEAKLLNLATDKAFHLLRWKAVWDFPETISKTVEWYRVCHEDPACDLAEFTRRQIRCYVENATTLGLGWASAAAQPASTSPAA